MKNIFLVASPLQVICAYELSKNFSSDENILCPLYKVGSEVAGEQITESIQIFKFKDILRVDISSNSVTSYFEQVIKFCLIRARYRSRNYRLIIGDFRNSAMHLARLAFLPTETYVIDDGFSSYIAIKNFTQHKIYFNTSSKKLRFILKVLGFYQYLTQSPVKLFTIYEPFFSDQNLLLNDFKYTKQLLNIKSKTFDDSIVYFIGGKLSERGAICLEDELIIMKNIYEYWKLKGKKIIYIAKRTSSDKKLNKLQELGMETQRLEYPIELFLMKNELLPKYICGFGSSLFATLPPIFPQITYICFKFPTQLFNNSTDKSNYSEFLEFVDKSSLLKTVEKY
tara:strand:+ start:553 stop:1569 length:1017 start_codon:yes stop_codon:yes gene_type:complete